jgi:tetratricopeptide (TPR) repeat protein
MTIATQKLSRTTGLRITALVMSLLLQACSSTPSTTPGEQGPALVFDQSAYDSALSLMKAGKYEKAALKLEDLSRTDDERAGPYINLGIAYRHLGKLEEARQALKLATERRAGREIAWNELGLVYRRMGEFEKARDAYERSIRERASYGKAYLNLGILCDIYLEDLTCAIRNYEKYRKLGDSEANRVKLWLADVRNRAGKPAGKQK